MCKGRKDILVCVHIRNILRARGCYRNVKVPSSPYKRGREGTCKRIQTFWDLCYLQRASLSLCALIVYLNVLRTPLGFGYLSEFFGYSPNIGYQDRLLGGPLALPDLCRTVPDGVRRKDYGGEVLG
jgi:hypothetical protein